MIARALGILAVASALLTAVAIAHVQARASELASEVAPALLAYAGAARDEGARVLRVNGASVELRTGVTADSIEVVLARQREACGAADVLPIVHWRSAMQGVLGCFAPPDGMSLSERLLAFVRSGDLAALGEPRVTWVLAADGARRYALLSAPDPLALTRMFPAQGDAPGFDAPGLPRPPHARRVLSAVQEGDEPMLVAYRSDLAVEELERTYGELLEAQGRRVDRGDGPDGPRLLVRSDDRAQLVLLGSDGSGALAVIVPLPTQPGAVGAR